MRILADGSGHGGVLIKATVNLGSIKCLGTSDFVLLFMCHTHMVNVLT